MHNNVDSSKNTWIRDLRTAWSAGNMYHVMAVNTFFDYKTEFSCLGHYFTKRADFVVNLKIGRNFFRTQGFQNRQKLRKIVNN